MPSMMAVLNISFPYSFLISKYSIVTSKKDGQHLNLIITIVVIAYHTSYEANIFEKAVCCSSLASLSSAPDGFHMALYQADTDFYILNDNHLHDATEFDVPAGVKRTAY